MRRFVWLLAAVLAACSSETPSTTSIVTIPPSSTTNTTAPNLEECPAVPYAVRRLPSRVTTDPADADDLQLDEFTSIGGTQSLLWVDEQGNVAVALIRGTLPPQDWPGERGEVDVAGTRAVVGPFTDGKWVAAWFEGEGNRCDLYTMVFYPPVEAEEVQLTLASIVRNP